MPAIQTSITERMRKAVAGQRATMLPAAFISRSVESAAGIGFGLPAARGTGDNQCKLWEAGAAFLGITARERSINPDTEADKFAQYEAARIQTAGDIWVVASVNVADGEAVYLVAATGLFTNVSAGNIAISAVFDTTATAGNLVRLRFI